ncbi:hypothetical protein Bca52824_017360 [Brassica carinata]|uniref:Uncharacterized protein n=1 Tax=Brassica carinata TaxID=52824 RepID=A0A8X7VM10_BRACI|nr:hypothetical protein Bca52824_017360 [Brassica carinata]
MQMERVSQRAQPHQAPVQTVTTCSRTHRSDSQGIHQHTMSQLSCQRLEPSWEVILGYKTVTCASLQECRDPGIWKVYKNAEINPANTEHSLGSGCTIKSLG